MGICALLFLVFFHISLIKPFLIACRGFAFGLLPVGWSAWIARTVPQKAESAGGLLVASVQFAISIGSAIGRGIFDLQGSAGIFIGCIALFISATVIIISKVNCRLRDQIQ